MQCTKTITLSSVFLEFLPFVHFFFRNFCPEDISKSMKARNFELHTHIELIEEVCSAEDALLCLQYFWSYCSLYIFTLNFCPEHISKSIKARNLKLYTYIELIEEKCSAQNHNSVFSIFGDIALCKFELWIFVRSISPKV